MVGARSSMELVATDDAPVSPAALPAAHAEPAGAEAGTGAGAGARLRSLLPDLAPRASADFRRLWLAGLITNFGSFLTFVALPVQMKLR